MSDRDTIRQQATQRAVQLLKNIPEAEREQLMEDLGLTAAERKEVR